MNCNNNTISNNTINKSGQYGIRVSSNSYDNIIANNSIDAQGSTNVGMRLQYADNTVVSGNDMVGFGIYIEGQLTSVSSHTIFTNNNVNGKTVYYYTGQTNLNHENFTGDGTPAQIILVQCTDSMISGYDLSDTSVGIQLYYSENITISNKTARNTVSTAQNEGIRLLNNCNENIIEHNYLFNNTDSGIALFDDCSEIIIRLNNASFNGKAGIELNESNSNKINNNIAKNNIYGLLLNSSSNNCIYGNILINNDHNYNESGVCVGNGDCRSSSNGTPSGGDDDDDDEAVAIPFGNFYLYFLFLSVISLVLIKRKTITHNSN
ncbi:MAG: hypothetical protein GF353_30105 [Candidatus Lokiarchaeota archaeon]|nr:hypothetical protein [Candidatus Lokiarchaeota archaeon]